MVQNPGGQSGAAFQAVNLTVNASDPDNDTLSYAAQNLPSGLSINATTGAITGSPSNVGQYNVTVKASDGKGGEDSKSFQWEIISAMPGLVGWWKFDDASGTAVRDSSGYGNDGTIDDRGTTPNYWAGSSANGRPGSALVMNGGNNSIVRFKTSPSLQRTENQITAMAWAYLEGWKNVDLFGHGYPFVFLGFHLETDGSGNPTFQAFKWQIATDNTDANRRSIYNIVCDKPHGNNACTMQLGRWYHLAGTYDGKNLVLYVNGVQAGSDSFPTTTKIPMPSTDFSTSGYLHPDDRIEDEINGQIDDVRVFDRALTASEVKSIYDATK